MKSFIVGFCIILAIVSFVFCSCSKNHSDKVGYVITEKVFSDFQGTKEMEKKFKGLQDKQKFLLDSIAIEIKTLEAAGKISSEQLNNKKQTYNRLLDEFRQNNVEQDQEYTDGLWKQINQYVNDYGKENNYIIIHGANGTGSIMYADTTINITDDVVKYMNQKYAGK